MPPKSTKRTTPAKLSRASSARSATKKKKASPMRKTLSFGNSPVYRKKKTAPYNPSQSLFVNGTMKYQPDLLNPIVGYPSRVMAQTPGRGVPRNPMSLMTPRARGYHSRVGKKSKEIFAPSVTASRKRKVTSSPSSNSNSNSSSSSNSNSNSSGRPKRGRAARQKVAAAKNAAKNAGNSKCECVVSVTHKDNPYGLPIGDRCVDCQSVRYWLQANAPRGVVYPNLQ